MERGRIVRRADIAGRDYITMFRAVIRYDGKTAAGREPILGHDPLTVWTHAGRDPRVTG